MKLCVVILTNGVPTVQNVKSTYKTLAFMANLATEDQDEAVYDALPKNKNFRLNYKKKQRQTMKKYAEFQRQTIL